MCFVCNYPEHKLRLNTGQEFGRGRVLALDGGGVRGHIQLEILALLEREIGLDLPLRYFFDLIVGTSIGEEFFFQK
jgi:patatin-like phospholipase/acyl hydrolase